MSSFFLATCAMSFSSTTSSLSLVEMTLNFRTYSLACFIACSWSDMMVLSSGTSQGNMSSSLITLCCSISAVTFCRENGVALTVEQYLKPNTSQSTCWSLMYERIKGINRASSCGRFSKVSSKMSRTLLGSRLK